MKRLSFKTQLVAMVAFLLVTGLGCLWYENFGPGYDSELRAIRGDPTNPSGRDLGAERS